MSDFERPSLSDLVKQAQSDINGRVPGADSRLRRNVLGVFARVWAGLTHGLYGLVDSVVRELFVHTAILLLPVHAAIWGIDRNTATFASGVIPFTGLDDSFVPEGTVIQRRDGFRYQTTADVTFDGTTADLPVIALVAGAAGNAITGTVMSFVSPVSGVVSESAVGVTAIEGGNDIEGLEYWRGRILARIRNPPEGGAATDYERWGLEVAGVTRVWVYPRFLGAGTVALAFVYDGRDDIFPSSPERIAFRGHIDAKCPVHLVQNSIYVNVLTPSPLDPEIHLDVDHDTPTIRLAVEAQLKDVLAREAIPGGTIIRSHLEEAISLAAGEYDHDLVSPAANVTHTTGHMATLGTIDWGD